MIKRIILALVCILLIAIPCTVSAVAPMPSRMLDSDNLLTSNEEDEILAKLDTLSEQHNCDIIIATISSLGPYTVEEYSDITYQNMGFGMGSSKDGFMLLICLESRDWAITSYGNAGNTFTNSRISDIRDDIMPYLSAEEFYTAFDIFAEDCKDILEGNGTSTTFSPVWILVAIGIGASIAFITVLIMKSQLKSVRSQPAANNYLKGGSLNLTTQREIFLYSTITRRAKPQQTSSSGAGSPGPRQSGKF